MVHGGVAHHHGVHDLRGHGAGLGAQIGDDLVEGLGQAGLQQAAVFLGAVGKGDAADHVFAVGDLRVHHPAARQGGAAVQVHQVDRQLGRAHVGGQPQQARARAAASPASSRAPSTGRTARRARQISARSTLVRL